VHFGHGGRISGCVNATNVDERIATGWRGIDERKISSKHALVSADDELGIASESPTGHPRSLRRCRHASGCHAPGGIRK
jgi:hypothetical protein